MSTCRGCGATIRWVKGSGGRSLPIDAKPEKRVVIRLVHEAQFSAIEHGDVVDTYAPHWSTCPKASEFRKPK